MEINLDAPLKHDFVTVPPGRYLCRVAEVRVGVTRAGDERWSLRLVVIGGPQIGKQAAWDSLVFSTRGRIHARMVLRALGMPASGKVQIEPSDVEGRQAVIEVRMAEYQSPGGDVVRRNEVLFDGWTAPEQHLDKPADETGIEPIRSQIGLRGKSSCAAFRACGKDRINIRFTSGRQQLITFDDGGLLRFAQDVVRRFGPKP